MLDTRVTKVTFSSSCLKQIVSVSFSISFVDLFVHPLEGFRVCPAMVGPFSYLIFGLFFLCRE